MQSGESRVKRSLALPIVGWSALTLVLVGAFIATIGALNMTVYGSSMFVQRYLEAISRDQISQILEIPGVALSDAELEERGLPADTSVAMLRAGVISTGPKDVRIVSDVAEENGDHTVTASYRLGSSITESTFTVSPLERLWGVLDSWSFTESPLSVINVTVQHGALFSVGSLDLDTRATKSGDELKAFSQSAPYLVVAPAEYELGYESTLLKAAPVDLSVAVGEPSEAIIDLQPTTEFVSQVQSEIDEYLAQCTTQQVLQPAGCPFGIAIDDRIRSEPVWTIVTNPVVTLTPGEDAFVMPATEGTAHISVEVQSLFDGDIEQLEEDRPIVMGLTVRIKPDGVSLAIEIT
ncbi:hypothetical protein [Agromyces atrinae]|uniref:Uncharacterized protein n=1 Tax=Agromyces atrinae TaxID=592376 RepID=A0A4Q2MD04_9MICO|nr:hypothetical protein [Agromyces atrinae]NYD67899.1 hypothetical protein [Agromyces atrinae]RXZ87932.1 hypothetical protein ESP50_01680 [Agromyces atrinae]